MEPDFLCLGAQKAGTTWLYARLCDHPEFSMPPVKELHYFDRSRAYPSPNALTKTKLLKRLRKARYIKTALKTITGCLRSRNFRLARWWSLYYFQNYSDAWYQRLFDSANGITGDITPSYSILEEKDVARLFKVAPHAQLVFILRNPIDRAWSMYRYEGEFGRSIDLNDLDAFKGFVNSPSQELRSNYVRTIDLFLKYFNPDQLLLGFYDAIIDQPELLLSEILNHIGSKNTSNLRNLRQINNQSQEIGMPEHYREYLERKYRDDLEELAQRYGGYASRWSFSARNNHAEHANGAPLPPPVVHL